MTTTIPIQEQINGRNYHDRMHNVAPPWHTALTNMTLETNAYYSAQLSATPLVFTLPSNPKVGDFIYVVGAGGLAQQWEIWIASADRTRSIIYDSGGVVTVYEGLIGLGNEAVTLRCTHSNVASVVWLTEDKIGTPVFEEELLDRETFQGLASSAALIGAGYYGTWASYAPFPGTLDINVEDGIGSRHYANSDFSSHALGGGDFLAFANKCSLAAPFDPVLEIHSGSAAFSFTKPTQEVDSGAPIVVMIGVDTLGTFVPLRSIHVWISNTHTNINYGVIALSNIIGGPGIEVYGSGEPGFITNWGDGLPHLLEWEFDLSGTHFMARVDSGDWVSNGDGRGVMGTGPALSPLTSIAAYTINTFGIASYMSNSTTPQTIVDCAIDDVLIKSAALT